MHAFVRQTDGQADRQTDRQMDGRTDSLLIARVRLHSMQRGNNGSIEQTCRK